MDVLKSPISVSEYCSFHAKDRSVYSILAFDLLRDPIESVQILAFWLLLERLNCRNLVKYMLSLNHSILSIYADEAMTCLKCIKELQFVPHSHSLNSIPMTSNLFLGGISLQYFYQNRVAMGKKLEEIISGVCAKALPDLVVDAIKNREAYDSWVNNFGSGGEQSQSNRCVGLVKDYKTAFVTFSRGFPVSEAEVKSFFTNRFGVDCIEAIHMQQVHPHKQALYARVVFTHPSFIDNILNDAGAAKAKFSINGKHFWVRKYESKNRTSLP